MTAATELREQADRLDRETATADKGKVFIMTYSGLAYIHTGDTIDNYPLSDKREASEAEVQALCTIPEFKAHLDRVRGV